MNSELKAQVHLAQVLRERLRSEFPDADEETLEDTLSGLTDLPEILSSIVRSQLDDQALSVALKQRISDMQARLSRLSERIQSKRDLVSHAMQETGMKRLTEPDFTVSVRPSRPPLTIIDEEAIPAEYWRPQPAKLDRQGLIARLQAGRDIPGAVLGNASMTISVRTK